ncbi:DUF3131 domain-containing protein [Chelativorans salis]|uniref:DUF3131 domain-containing protein n=1 Tax=Chelativorans salis TaxID=2978478 RepID=A0ABT2LHM1_9HYPH|nr:DUF3131 domain-containing protein [Chelativorans sp. EGI FJ00035]MCT7374060.1 DUF3131 domain-containing protein [Chelativorans sp. EGI FJ00035]
MSITRRGFLLAGAAAPIMLAAGRNTSFAASSATLPNPLILSVSGVDGASDPARLARLIDPIIASGIPLLLTVSPFDTEGHPLDYNSAMAAWLRRRIDDSFDALEIGLHVETIEADAPYFQLRLASQAQAVFAKALNDYTRYRTKALVEARTLTTTSPARAWQDCAAMRAAGIHSVIHLPSGRPDKAGLQPVDGGYWMAETGLMNIFAAPQSSIRPSGRSQAPLGMPDLVNGVKSLSKGNEPIVIDIPLQSLAGMSAADLEDYGKALAQIAHRLNATGVVRQILPRTLYRQSHHTHRFVIIRIDDLRLTQAGDMEHMAFTRSLLEAGYPVTEAIIPSPPHGPVSKDEASRAYIEAMFAKKGYDVATHGWQHTFQEMLGKSPEANLKLVRDGASELFKTTGRVPTCYVPPNNAFDENTLDALARTGASTMAADKSEDLAWFRGMDRRGLLHVSETVMFEQEWSGDIPYRETDEVLDRLGEDNDAVFSIHPLTANTPEKKRQIMEVLETLTKQSGTRLANFSEYYEAVVPLMPTVERIRQARADVMIRDWRPDAISAATDAALKEDAAFAWRYFEWGAKNFGGMVPATAWPEGRTRQGYPYATMWDVGSYIMAAISAHRIDLVDDTTFETTASRILSFLAEESYLYKGSKLPPTERSLENGGKERKGFDSADTGRLLIALKILDRYTNGELPVARLVAGWDFDNVLRGGKMHIVKNGRLVPVHDNSYANYVSRGYRLWNHPLNPVFDVERPDTDMDDAVRAFSEIARRGRLATEPHLTEEIELGGSPHGRLMSDILYSAQMKRYSETGVLTCVSEGPVRGRPFFVYQGYQINEDGGGTFVVDAPKDSDIAYTARKEEALRAVSTKGSYLWHAARPGAYSSKLMEFVRKEARIPGIGFATAISEATGKRFEVCDVNTNGIILEAAAHVLGGRKPFLQEPSGTARGF